MNPSLNTVIQTFRENYKGLPLAFFIAGGGFSCLDFRRYPGSSKMYHTAVEPYNEDTVNFLNKFADAGIADPHNFNFVNPEGTLQALEALENYCDNSGLAYVVVNSALTTDRWRRGDNRAYIALSNGDIFIFKLSKLDEDSYRILSEKNPRAIDEYRRREDDKVGQVVLSILLNDPTLCPELDEGEEIVRLKKLTTGPGGWNVPSASDIFAAG